jgi:hypothetical protein
MMKKGQIMMKKAEVDRFFSKKIWKNVGKGG